MPPPPGRHLIFFDGVCGLCGRLVQFVLRHDKTGRFLFAPLQGKLAEKELRPRGIAPEKLESMYLVVGYGTEQARVLEKGRAILFVGRELGGIWSIAAIFWIIPTPVLNFFYDLVSRRRYRIFGKLDACMVPSPEQRGRFLMDTE